eukprot:m.116912 g.116912  ORF g.116912 m.116912 type:complete len:676 (-) comp15525_c1_seq4:95-2122(-)
MSLLKGPATLSWSFVLAILIPPSSSVLIGKDQLFLGILDHQPCVLSPNNTLYTWDEAANDWKPLFEASMTNATVKFLSSSILVLDMLQRTLIIHTVAHSQIVSSIVSTPITSTMANPMIAVNDHYVMVANIGNLLPHRIMIVVYHYDLDQSSIQYTATLAIPPTHNGSVASSLVRVAIAPNNNDVVVAATYGSNSTAVIHIYTQNSSDTWTLRTTIVAEAGISTANWPWLSDTQLLFRSFTGVPYSLDIASSTWQRIAVQRAAHVAVLYNSCVGLYNPENTCLQVHRPDQDGTLGPLWKFIGSVCEGWPIVQTHSDGKVLYLQGNGSIVQRSANDILVGAGDILARTTPTSKQQTSRSATPSMIPIVPKAVDPARPRATTTTTIVSDAAVTSTPGLHIQSSPSSLRLIVGIGAGILAMLGVVASLVYWYQRRKLSDRTHLLQLYTSDVTAVCSEDAKPIEEWHEPVKGGELPGWQQLRSALEQGNANLAYADCLSEEELNRVDEHGRSLLTHACIYDDWAMAARLTDVMNIQTTAKLDATGRAPIHWACLVNSIACVKAIIRSPAALDHLLLETASGQNLLHLAVQEANVQFLGLLLESGSGRLKFKLFHTDSNGETATDLAARLQNEDCHALLVEKVTSLQRKGETTTVALVRPTACLQSYSSSKYDALFRNVD